MQPFYTTLGTEGWRPDGCHMPLCAAGAGPFGNTASHRFFTKAHGFPAAAGGIGIYIYDGAEGAVPRQRSDTIYLPRAEARSPSGRRQPVPDRTLGAQGQRPGGAINPRPRKTTVGRLNGRPFYGQAKGQLRPTCTSYAGCAHQPSGILESTAQVPVPIPTAPEARQT